MSRAVLTATKNGRTKVVAEALTEM